MPIQEPGSQIILVPLPIRTPARDRSIRRDEARAASALKLRRHDEDTEPSSPGSASGLRATPDRLRNDAPVVRGWHRAGLVDGATYPVAGASDPTVGIFFRTTNFANSSENRGHARPNVVGEGDGRPLAVPGSTDVWSDPNMKILIVDDSKAMRMIITRSLRQAELGELTLFEASNGAEALACVASDQPDLVLTDWNMPTMNGLELLQALQAQGAPPKVGVVTSEGTVAIRHAASSAGAAFIITKPFTPEIFRAALSPVLR